MTTVPGFVTEWSGKYVNFPAALDPAQSHQCVALFWQFNREINVGEAYKAPGACDLWAFPWKSYALIPAGQQQYGDWGIWSGTTGAYPNKGAGHVALFIGPADTPGTGVFFSQNPGTPQTMILSNDGVRGYLRMKPVSILGADISGWQPSQVNMAWLVFVYVKATEGIYMSNANHDAQVAEARAGGLIVGHYHFPSWGNPVTEAQAFLIGAKWQVGDFMVLDIENSGASPWPADPVSWCVAFVKEVYRQIQIWCMDYIGPSSRRTWDWTPLAALGGGLISPEYNNTGPSDPSPWTNVAMWQNADTNQTGGDSDIFYGNRTQLTAYGTPAQVTAQGGGITPIPTYTPDQQFLVDLDIPLP